MLNSKLTKQVYDELLKSNENGLPNYISNVMELSKLYKIDLFDPKQLPPTLQAGSDWTPC